MKSRVVALSESLASFDAGMFHLSSFTLLLELIEKYTVENFYGFWGVGIKILLLISLKCKLESDYTDIITKHV